MYLSILNEDNNTVFVYITGFWDAVKILVLLMRINIKVNSVENAHNISFNRINFLLYAE